MNNVIKTKFDENNFCINEVLDYVKMKNKMKTKKKDKKKS